MELRLESGSSLIIEISGEGVGLKIPSSLALSVCFVGATCENPDIVFDDNRKVPWIFEGASKVTIAKGKETHQK